MNVKEIVKQYLVDNGYDGLYHNRCRCTNDDLMPCLEVLCECEPGYKSEDEHGHWIIGPKRGE